MFCPWLPLFRILSDLQGNILTFNTYYFTGQSIFVQFFLELLNILTIYIRVLTIRYLPQFN